MLVSIIIPIYKIERYIRPCIESVLSQTYRDLEIILIDDGSPDRCPQICDEYANKDPRVKVIHKKNSGLAEARNSGLNVCKGEYIAFVDGDDFIHKRYIEILLQACITQKSAVAIGKFERVPMEIDSSKKISEILDGGKIKCISGQEANYQIYNENWSRMIIAWGKLFHKSLLNGFYFPDVKLHEDEACIYKLLYSAKRVVLVDQLIYFYRYNPNGLMASRYSVDKMTMISILEERKNFYSQKGEQELIIKTINREFFTAVEYYQIIKKINAKNLKLAREMRTKQKELYWILMKNSSYSLKRKLIYTEALFFPKHFKRLYYMKM